MNQYLSFLACKLLLLFIFSSNIVFAQNKPDSTYQPKIGLSGVNGFGPYTIGSKRNNEFVVYNLPGNTSKVIMKFIDIDDQQIGKSYTKEGSEIKDAVWKVESDTMDFPLSPRFQLEVYYQSDSLAVYTVPYTVYPDTIKSFASAGWGPFITNNYQLTDTTWHDVPELLNTFVVSNLPPRTDTVKFVIISADSTVIDSSHTIAKKGQFLDSAAFDNVWMDLLPLDTRYLKVFMICEGGPDKGVIIHKELKIIPQNPKLFSLVDGIGLLDSLPQFIQDQTSGQALMVDINKYAEIQNGPGEYWKPFDEVQYQGPYSFDIIEGEFTIEAWLQFDWENILGSTGKQNIMSVESLWELEINSEGNSPKLYFNSILWNYFEAELVLVNLPIDYSTEWHHITYSYKYEDSSFNAKVYWDGNQLSDPDVLVNGYYFEGIQNYAEYKKYMKTESLIFGQKNDNGKSDLRTIKAMDEVRFWNYARSPQEIKSEYKKKVLQNDSLVGYWNFDDRRNRLKTISDVSYKNNIGTLRNGSYFIPQALEVTELPDTILFSSSNAHTDSILLSFVDKQNNVHYSQMFHTNNSCSLIYDISTISYKANSLLISEFFPGCPDKGFVTSRCLDIIPQTPIATPKFNWSTSYQNDGWTGELDNTILLSGLPENTSKLVIGFEKDGVHYDTMTFTQNSIPYRYSLTLNGEDNYMETSNEISSPVSGSISFWFKTTTTKGGKLIGFGTTQNGVNSTRNEREIIMEKNGSIRFIVNEYYTLYGEHSYNDGEWHFVSVSFGSSASLNIDGSVVDSKFTNDIESYSGYWILGRNHHNVFTGTKTINEYFEGSLSQIDIQALDNPQLSLLYKLDEGKGIDITDWIGNNNGVLKGGEQKWDNTGERLSFVSWKGNVIGEDAGVYTLFARLYYDGGSANGTSYSLGKFNIVEPISEDCIFSYYIDSGLGFFNEGVNLENEIHVETDYTCADLPDWSIDLVQGVFLSPDHWIIKKEVMSYTPGGDIFMIFDMGDAPCGSYINFSFGYIKTNNDTIITHSFPVPIYINQMIAPTVSGNFGPFRQAIAPGTMIHDNTFTITTDHLDDLNNVIGVFQTIDGNEIDKVDAVQINDTTWYITYDMAKLAPPETYLKIEYYLGQYTKPVLIEGPYAISIHKTRPKWFDFIADTSFHDIYDYSNHDSVTFSVNTAFEDNYLINNSSEMEIPWWVPLVGDTECKMKSPTGRAYLKYIISEHKLELDSTKSFDFFQKVFNLGMGTAETLRFGFNSSTDNSYEIDSLNNLIAIQNFAVGGSISSSFNKLENIAKKVKEMIETLKVADPETIIVSPSFSLCYSGSFEYSSRLRMIVDTITGEWGSSGNLDVDANPDHEEAYKNSTSYRFYSGALGTEFSMGVDLLDGILGAYFGLDGRFLLGFGNSYITIPEFKTKPLKSFTFQLYGRFYITALWGWYERNVWGPKMFWNRKIWGDDMTNAFPPMKKKSIEIESSDDFNIADSLIKTKPATWYNKIPIANPQQSISQNNNNRIFTWLEPEKSFGERKLRTKHFDSHKGGFSETLTITANRNALHSPSINMIDENTAVCAWVQTRHTPESILSVKSDNVPRSFAQALDIWYAVYDIENDSSLKMDFLEDETETMCSGRAEANPELTVLSDNRVLITWQVADLENHKADIWYTFLEKTNGEWDQSKPTILAEIDGVESEIKIASPEENVAVIVWKNTHETSEGYNRLLTSTFTGTYWTLPEEIACSGDGDFHNYFDMDFENDMGALVITDYIIDTVNGNFENLSILPWNPYNKEWSNEQPIILYHDSINHLQLPCISINESGTTAIGFKVEKIGSIDENERISQVDLIVGNIANPTITWKHIQANQLVCDTTKQVNDLDISFAGNDTIMILSHEFVMSAADMSYTPANGLRFGDPYMNLVLRSISFDEDGYVDDVNENTFFDNGNDTIIHHSDVVLGQSFPNPCNTSATVQIYLPVKTNVLLEIFDINGLRVGTAINQELEPGHYDVKLKVEILRQGTYIYRLTTDNSVKSMKMVVGK